MRVFVCGGRAYDNKRRVDRVLDIIGVTELGHGGAFGADMLADMWARENHVPVREFKAEWHKHGRGAGPIRNRRAYAEFRPDIVVAFPGGTGTADMVRVARAGGTRVVEVQ